MPRLDLFGCRFEYDDKDPEGYRAGVVQLGTLLDSHDTAIKLFEVPPRVSLCPYHYEYVEEWLLVLSGEVVVRTPDGEHAAPAGTLERFPAGPDGAHKIANQREQPARVLMFSSSREPSVAVYPDSDKLGVWPGNDQDRVMLHRADGRVPYYEGES